MSRAKEESIRPAKSQSGRPRRRKGFAKLPWWEVRSDKAICSDACGARCCKASFVSLTPAEAERLPKLAAALGLPQPEIVPHDTGQQGEPAEAAQEHIMYALPCTFLSKNNLCLIYRDRPEHCHAFPNQLLDWCPLSWKRFGDDR